MKLPLVFVFIIISFLTQAQSDMLESGPMLGYVEMREALLWVQTKEPAAVQISWQARDVKTAPEQSPVIRTEKTMACIAKFALPYLEPGTSYRYDVLVNGQKVELDYPTEFTTQPLWQYREDPPEFTVATGSCFYVNEEPYDRLGAAYGGAYRIFEQIHQRDPDLMLWLGDNTYLREVDWFSRSGILHRYTHTRAVEELQPLLASAHHYAIWDDHDFGPNNSDRSYIHKNLTREAFELFWGNPSYGLDGKHGITTFFQYGDIDFFLMDNRYFRAPNERESTDRTMLGKEQLEWLIDALTTSRAPFKVVVIGGQVLNTHEQYETYANLYPEERQYLLNRIREEEIYNVFFLDGDRHHTEFSKLQLDNGIMVHDMTCSPLTSGAHTNVQENNQLRVEGTLVEERNFAMLTFSGPRDSRKLQIEVFDADGKLLWEQRLRSQKPD